MIKKAPLVEPGFFREETPLPARNSQLFGLDVGANYMPFVTYWMIKFSLCNLLNLNNITLVLKMQVI
jgi:hypothetical protein